MRLYSIISHSPNVQRVVLPPGVEPLTWINDHDADTALSATVRAKCPEGFTGYCGIPGENPDGSGRTLPGALCESRLRTAIAACPTMRPILHVTLGAKWQAMSLDACDVIGRAASIAWWASPAWQSVLGVLRSKRGLVTCEVYPIDSALDVIREQARNTVHLNFIASGHEVGATVFPRGVWSDRSWWNAEQWRAKVEGIKAGSGSFIIVADHIENDTDSAKCQESIGLLAAANT